MAQGAGCPVRDRLQEAPGRRRSFHRPEPAHRHLDGDYRPGQAGHVPLRREKQDIARIRPHLGHYKLIDLRPEHFKKFYTDMRKAKNSKTGKPLSEAT
ncbi:MAG: hypothetical protein ACI3VP_09500, partial [Oscillospiraceae bacterium]